MFKQELYQIKKLVDAEPWELLADQGCMIAGGALTSVFTNKPVNDIDVYFPNKIRTKKTGVCTDDAFETDW